MHPTPDNMEPFIPRQRDPSREACPFCTRSWRACDCGEAMPQDERERRVLDAEQGLDVVAPQRRAAA